MYSILLLIIIGIILYINNRNKNKLTKEDSDMRYDHAIIMGGSIAGMTTAAYLSKYFKRITIIESDDVLNDTLMKSTPEELLDYRCSLKNASSLGRPGVSQSYQIHVLQGEGSKILFELFPNLKTKLLNEYGAKIASLKNEFRFVIGDVLLNKNLTEDLHWFCIDRFTLEIVLRRELYLQFNKQQIQWMCNTKVMQLIVDQSTNSVHGVKCRSKLNSDEQINLYADFIIDCTGRHSSSIKWLKQNFNLIIPTEQLHTGTGYVSFVGERLKTGNPLLDSIQVGGNAAHAPHHNKGFLTTPIREMKTSDPNSLGLLSNFAVYCVNSEYPPNDSYENLLEWVKEYLPIDYYLILKSTNILSPLLPYRRAFDDRKYVESLGRQWPRNYILLGDSMCVFNPKNGQGMTHACRQARQLNLIFKKNYPLKDIPYIYNRQGSSISEECWLGSITNDWAVPTLKLVQTDKFGLTKTYQRTDDSTLNFPQPKTPLFMQFLQWYTYWLIQCAAQSGELTTAFIHVVFQEKTPYSLLKPKFFLKILYSSIMNSFNLRKHFLD
jgi:2-polyprenyl-6-methoxyphenol hydroxylase-like FAD-dependent oxidoreductase